MRSAASRGSLARRLSVAAAVGVLVVTVVVGLLLRSHFGLQEAQRAAARSEAILSQTARTETLLADLETGLRGYATTGDRRVLEPYRRASSRGPAAARRLRGLVERGAERRQADIVVKGFRDFIEVFARPLLAGGDVPLTRTAAVAVAAVTRQRSERPRVALATIGRIERGRLATRLRAADGRADRAVVVSVLALIGLIGVVLILVSVLHRAVVRPVGRFGEAVGRLRRGEYSERLEQGGPREIAALGAAIDELSDTLASSRAQVEAHAVELRRLGERNLLLLDSVFAQTPAGLAFLDCELRYVRVNAAMAAMNGAPVESHAGRRVEEVTPGMHPRLLGALDLVLRTGDPVADIEVRGQTAAEPGVDHHWLVTYYPVREEGRLSGVGAVVLDITQRKRIEAEREAAFGAERAARRVAEAARSRAAFLAEAGAVLEESLDIDETLASLARLCVPRIADWCSFELVVPGGHVRNAAVAHTDPSRVELALELQERYPPDPAAPTGPPAVIRTGRPEHYPDIPDELVAAGAHDEEHLRIIRELGMVSAMVVPLTARGSTVGAITFVSAESGRRFDDDDFALAQDLGGRAAQALDNARLYRERTHVARTLQASLLPERLPEIPGVRLAARYQPLGAANEVGGDFYDVFPTGEGRWAMVIGDVCGKGAEAAALTALARYTLRAVAPQRPVEALRSLNAAILRQRDDLRFITIIYAELDLRGERPTLTLSSGGHPPALLVRADAAGELLTCAGTLIGVTEEPRLLECAFELRPGDTVAFYTDGVMESSHAEPLDADALLASLNGHRSADAVADRLQALARAEGSESARDDVAILAVEVA